MNVTDSQNNLIIRAKDSTNSNTKYHKPIRWGMIGCGDVAEVKSAPAYQQTKGFLLSGVMCRTLEKVKDYAQRHKIEKYYTDADQLINDPEIDAVYIATPPDSHMYYALKVAEANKPCCVEKPMAPTYKESTVMQKAFDEKGLLLFVAYYRRNLPHFQKIKAWIDKESIGQLRHIQWDLRRSPFDQDLSENYNWRTDSKVAPGGYFDDLASHGLDLFTYLLGKVKQVHGIGINQQQLYTAKDAIVACWLHENGVTGTGSWNFGCSTSFDTVIIYGSKGKIEFSVFEDIPINLNQDRENFEISFVNPLHIQKHHVEDMANQFFSGIPHPSNGSTAAHTSWVMDQILRN